MKSNILSVMIAIVAFCALALPALAIPPTKAEPKMESVNNCDEDEAPKPAAPTPAPALKTCWNGKKVKQWSECPMYDQCWDGKVYRWKNQCPAKPTIVEKKSVQCWDGSEAMSIDQCPKYVCSDAAKSVVSDPKMCPTAPAPKPDATHEVQCWNGTSAKSIDQCSKYVCSDAAKSVVSDPKMCPTAPAPKPDATHEVQCWNGTSAPNMDQCPRYVCPGTSQVVTDPSMCVKEIVSDPPLPETPKPASGPSLFDGKNFYLGLEAFVAGKFGAPYVVGPEGQPADRTVRPFAVGALGIPRLTLGLMSEDTIVAVSGFVAPYSVLEFVQDDARAWQPYPGLMAGGGVKVLTRPSDNFAWGGEVQAVFHATGLDVSSGDNALSSWAVMAGPTVSLTLMRLEGIGRIELNGSLLAGYEQGWTTVNDMPTQYPGTFVAMPSIGLGFSFGGATKPVDTGYHE